MFIDLIRQRRSVRLFEDKPVEPEKIELLIEAALRSPSSRSINPWEFIVVNDRDTLVQLSKAKPHGSSFLKNAALGFVVCADETQSDVWVEDTSIATILVQMAAESLGLGSCWVQIRKRAHTDGEMAETYVARLLDLPDNLKVESIIAIGYPADKNSPHPESALQYEKIFFNFYGNTYKSL